METTSLTKSFLIYGVGNMLYTVVILLLIPVYLEKLNVSDYGTFSVLYVTGNLISIGFSISISNGLLRYFSEFHTQFERRLGVSTITAFFFALFSFVLTILYLVSAFFDIPFFEENGGNVFIIVIWSFARIYYTMILGVLRAVDKPVNYVLLTIIDILGLCLINLYIIFFTHFDVASLLAGYLLAAILSMLIGFISIRQYVNFQFSSKPLKYLLFYGIPLSLANLISYLISYGNRYFLIYYTTKEDVAIFDVSQKITGLMGVILVNAFMISFTPFYLKLYDSVEIPIFKKKINEIIGVFTSVFFLMGILVVISDNFFLSFLSKVEYERSALYTPFLILANAFNVLFMLLAMTTNINKKTTIEMAITVCTLFVGVVSNIFLIRFFGLIGAGLSQILMGVVSFILINVYNKKYFPLDFKFRPIFIAIVLFCFIALADYLSFKNGLQPGFKIFMYMLFLSIYLAIFNKHWAFVRNIVKMFNKN